MLRWFFITLLIVGLSYSAFIGYKIFTSVDKIVDSNNSNNINVTQQPFNVLLIGMDETELDTGRADSLNLATINPQSQTIQMTSIPRDTYVEIPCKNNLRDKITHAHAYGGTECTIDTIEQLLDTSIDFYLKINFNGFVDIIDALGGIEMNVPDLRSGFLSYIQSPDDEGLIPFPEQMVEFQKGTMWCESDSNRERYAICFNEFGMQHVNGEQALALARTRHYDSDGDRGNRQMEVVKAVATKALSVQGVFSINGILDAAANNIATNMSINQMTSMLSLAQNILAARGGDINGFAFRTLQIQGDGYIFEGELNGRAWYMIPYIESIEYLQQQISMALNLSPVISNGEYAFNANYQYPRPETINGLTPMYTDIVPSEDTTPVIDNDPITDTTPTDTWIETPSIEEPPVTETTPEPSGPETTPESSEPEITPGPSEPETTPEPSEPETTPEPPVTETTPEPGT